MLVHLRPRLIAATAIQERRSKKKPSSNEPDGLPSAPEDDPVPKQSVLNFQEGSDGQILSRHIARLNRNPSLTLIALIWHEKSKEYIRAAMKAAF
jgi:hypothetical protein